MKKLIIVAIFWTLAESLAAQVREDTLVFVAPPIAEPAMAAFLHEHFTMEVMGANYTLTESRSQSDFIIALEVMENMVLFEDGSVARAPDWMPQYLLQLSLTDNVQDFEMLSFSFPFTEVDEIFEFSLTMVYQAMANVPVTRLGDVPLPEIDDAWRNMWLYFRVSFDFPVFLINADPNPRGVWIPPDDPQATSIHFDHRMRYVPGATIGIELHFLDWMSAELAFMLRFGDGDQYTFVPGIGLRLKFPLKPRSEFMVSPYLAYNRVLHTGGANVQTFPTDEVGGGIQLAARGIGNGAFFIDINAFFSIQSLVIRENIQTGNASHHVDVTYSRRSISVGFGHKFGSFERLPPFRRTERR